MSTTHPNALLMEASEKRQLAQTLISQADTLEAQAKELTGSEPVDESAEPTPSPDTAGVVPDGFPIREATAEEAGQPSPEDIEQTLEATEAPKEEADGGEGLPAELAEELQAVEAPVPTSEVPIQVQEAQPEFEPAVYGAGSPEDINGQEAGTVNEQGRQIV